MKIEREILSFISSRQTLPQMPEEVLLRVDMIGEGYLDSLGIVLMLSHLEEVFNIEFNNEEIQSPDFRSVTGIAKLIRERK